MISLSLVTVVVMLFSLSFLCCIAYLVSNFGYEDISGDRSTKLPLFKKVKRSVDAVLERFNQFPLISKPQF